MMGRKITGLAAVLALTLSAPEACSGDESTTHPDDVSSSAPRPHEIAAEKAAEAVVEAQEAAEASRQVQPPWSPPTDVEIFGAVGAAQQLAADNFVRAAEKVAEFEKPDVGSPEWFRDAAIAGRAHRLTGQFERAIEVLEPANAHKRRCRNIPCELLGYELARARIDWVNSGTLSPEDADTHLRAAASELLTAIGRRPNRQKAEMRVAYSKSLALIQGKTPKARYWAAKRAARSLERTLRDFPNHPEAGHLRLERARAQIRSREYTAASVALRQLAIDYTGQGAGEEAWTELRALAEARHRIKARPWTRKEQLRRAVAARRSRWVDVSRRILDDVLEDEKSPAYIRRNAQLSRAYTAYKQRDYSQCADDFRELYDRTHAIKMRDELTRCLDRAGRYDEAIDLWLGIANKKKASKSANATGLWNALSLAFRGGKYEQAQQILTKYERRFRSHSLRRRWLHAWLPYRMRKRDEALKGFRKLERVPKYKTMARYFRGKLLLEGDQPDRQGGREVLSKLISDDPVSYYGVMARQRLLDAGVDPGNEPRLVPMEDEDRWYGYGETRERFEAVVSEYGAFSTALKRANQLHAAGWIEEARRELRVVIDEYVNGRARITGQYGWTPRNEDIVVGLGWRAEWSYPKAKPGPRGRKLLRQPDASEGLRTGLRELASALGEPHRFAKLTSSSDYSYRSRWHVRAFRDVIEREASRRDVDSFDLWSLMYTESRFRRHVVSNAGARGALQIMPWTGRQLQERLGEFDGTFDPDILFDIEANAYLAGYYVGELMTKFQQQPPLVYASYNGGPNNVARWLRAKSDGRPLDVDDFIEEIPFNETQRYTRRVMETQAAYSLMYDGRFPRWSNELEPQIEDNIDF